MQRALSATFARAPASLAELHRQKRGLRIAGNVHPGGDPSTFAAAPELAPHPELTRLFDGRFLPALRGWGLPCMHQGFQRFAV